ncbi:MAG: leucine-rich repeat protein [Candidatus Pelethousia sp.]|nr:leucine-rich repeat protein [Candidatus Pelethousia sp.]
MKSKRFLCICLCVALVFAPLPKTALALLGVGATFTANTSEGHILTYKVLTEDDTTKTGTVQVGKGTASAITGVGSGSLTIPGTVMHGDITYTVTAIGEIAFASCSGFDGTLTIPESVTSIGKYAFGGCKKFSGALVIPTAVTTIGESAFTLCSGFTGPLTLPPNLTTISQRAFYFCSGFTGALVIPNTVITIGSEAFYGCTGLSSLDLGGGVQSIGDLAFAACTGLTGTQNIPDKLETIGNNAFFGCTGLSSLSLGSGVKEIQGAAFSGCSGLTGTLTIPNSVETISDNAFEGCTGITGLTLGTGLTFVGISAFTGCTNLNDARFLGNRPTIANKAFDNCAAGLTLQYNPAATGWSGYTYTGNSTVNVTASTAPAITGPTSLTLSPGYAATFTGAYTITGTEPITVEKISGDSKITWNNSTKKLDIAAGLPAGSYPVTLKASNGVLPDATFLFTLTVGSSSIPAFTITGNTAGYTYDAGVLTFTTSGNYMVTMTPGATTTDRIVVSGGTETSPANLTLNGVSIDCSAGSACAVELTGASAVSLTLISDNNLKSGDKKAGLGVPGGASLTIGGTGALTAIGGNNGAGIGGGEASAGGKVTITGGTVTASGNGGGAGIGGGGAAIISGGNGGPVTISGGTVTASGGGAGIGGGAGSILGHSGGSGGIITISGGTVTANGGGSCAGIGGGYLASGGTVTISGGTVEATGGSSGAGIGGGAGGAGGTVYISGGSVNAVGGDYAQSIGRGSGSADAGTLRSGGYFSENVYLTTVTLEGVSDETEVTSLTATYIYGINDMFTDGGGNLYLYLPEAAEVTGAETASAQYTGKVVTTTDATSRGTLFRRDTDNPTITGVTPTGTGVAISTNTLSVTFNEPMSTSVAGTVTVSGATVSAPQWSNGNKTVTYTLSSLAYGATYTISISGFQDTSGNVMAADNTHSFTTQAAPLPAFSVTGNTAGYTYDGGVLTFMQNGTYTVSMATPGAITATDRIVVQSGVTADITLDGVNIDVSAGGCAFNMTGAAVNLTLEGDNVLKSGKDNAGLSCPDGAVLSIGGAGSLTATGGIGSIGSNGRSGAGIGGEGSSGGNITINSGTVMANGGNRSAGIGGGGLNESGGAVIINDGSITANGGNGGAGIGGGRDGGGGAIDIHGGSITATGGESGVGMGGSGGTITISGGMVTATGGSYNAGIGGNNTIIAISGGRITANGGGGSGIGGGGAGIGGSTGCDGGTITISGGKVTATGGASSHGGGAGIGGGNGNSSGGTVYISGGSIKAKGKSGGQDIGHGSGGSGGTLKNRPAAQGGVDVFLTTVELEGVNSETAVTSLAAVLSGIPYGYGVNDMFTDAEGKLYLYLPATTALTGVQTATTQYTGYILTQSPSASGTLLADTMNPIVTGVTPTGTGVAISTDTLSITFNEPMKTSLAGIVEVRGATVSTPQWSNGGQTVTYSLSGLAYDTTYVITIAGFQDASGNEMLPDNTWRGFVTEAAPPHGDDGPVDPYIFRTLTDSATSISVSGYIHKHAALTVQNTYLHAAGTCAACDAIRQRMGESGLFMLIGKDISLSYGFSGSLTITIPVGNAYNGQTVTILHCANGTLQTYTATVKDGKAVFTATSLSPFVVFADGILVGLPKTGGSNGFPLWLGLMALALACMGYTEMKRRRI